jgi:hypothetical protein
VTAVVLLVAVVETEEQGEAEEPDQAVAQVVRPDLVAVVAQDKVEVLLEVLAVKAERAEMRQPTVASQTEDIDFANC